MPTKILFVSGSIGLGHVTRDLAIAAALRRRSPGLEIAWLAAEPAASALLAAGERLHPDSTGYRSDTAVAERVAGEGALSLLTYAFTAYRAWLGNALVVRRLLAREQFDVVLADETYELLVAQMVRLLDVPAPFVLLYDFLGLEPMTGRRSERLGVYFWNLVWSRDARVLTRGRNRGLFIGELEDIPSRRFGPLLPSRREHGRRFYEFVGYVLPFDPAALADRQDERDELGYGNEPLLICAVGGTAVGRKLLQLCGDAYPSARERIANLHMVLVCGPGIDPRSLSVPAGVDVRGFVPELYRHFAACDLAVVLGGGTTTLELTALRRPFLFFPLAGHCEQEITVAGRLRRHGAGVRMSLGETSPAALADVIVRTLGTSVNYPAIPTGGAERIAEVVLSRSDAARVTPPDEGPGQSVRPTSR